jgi:creatinine amidohydrolase/Fe(II)-dependent formamide hydrolase-like protein
MEQFHKTLYFVTKIRRIMKFCCAKKQLFLNSHGQKNFVLRNKKRMNMDGKRTEMDT